MNYRIAVIGESDAQANSAKYKLAEELGKALIDNDYTIQHGGRSGIMEAVTKGAKCSEKYNPGKVIGIMPEFGTERANKYLDTIIPTGLDYFRNGIVINADAVIAVGGGAGTLSEMAMAWTMKKLILAYDVEGWSGKLADKMIDDRKRVEFEDDKVFKVSNSEEVISLLKSKIDQYAHTHRGI